SRKRKSIDHGHYPLSECGSPAFHDHSISNRLKRIVRGARAQPYMQPWLGQVVRGGVNICGASLISRIGAEQTLWVISAAHCFLGSSSFNLQVFITDEQQRKFVSGGLFPE
uniref:Peptidase S1 domain-containing protein n=1 Tax=Romanomermis culicivorax TaxID=13658 RepID=A0A915KD36_ROMCU